MTTNVAIAPDLSNELATLFQYTVEAYKTFEKFAENLPNPLAAAMFGNFAEEERAVRDLLDAKYRKTASRMKVTLSGDLRFQDLLEGDLSYRESAEMLMVRERSMERKLQEIAKGAGPQDRNLYMYIAAIKRVHVAFLERELQLLRIYPDWFKREDALNVIVHGETTE